MTSLRVQVIPLEQLRRNEQLEHAYEQQQNIRRLYRRQPKPGMFLSRKQMIRAIVCMWVGGGIVCIFAYWLLTAVIDALGNLFGF